MAAPVLGRGPNGNVAIDVDRLVASRLLLTAMSGAGKSWALRRILEQTHGKVQHLVIDPEGEFYTLREKHDYVLASASEGADCQADAKSAKLLARMLLEISASAILDIYELEPDERAAFVAAFLSALVNAPRKLWRPVLVVVDEAHVYCPEGKGSAESGKAVAALMTRGRKRGFCGLLATQRLAELSKTAAAQATNVLIGRERLDRDVDRACTALGFTKSEGAKIKRLRDGEFYAHGPALCEDVEVVKVGPVRTTHPEPGAVAPPAPPTPGAIAKLAAQLAELPEAAREEAATIESLEGELKAARRQIRALERDRGAPDPEALARAREEGVAAGARQAQDAVRRALHQAQERDARVARDRQQAVTLIDKVRELVAAPIEPLDIAVEDLPAPKSGGARPAPERRVAARASSRPSGEAAEVAEGLSGPMQKILDAIAWLNHVDVEVPQMLQIAAAAGYAVHGGGFRNPIGRLRSLGLVDYVGQGCAVLTERGRELANEPDPAMSVEEMHERVLATLPGVRHRQILGVLLDAHPEAVRVEEIAEQLEPPMEATGGGFRNPLGKLRTLGLVEYPERGYARARDVLFLGD